MKDAGTSWRRAKNKPVIIITIYIQNASHIPDSLSVYYLSPRTILKQVYKYIYITILSIRTLRVRNAKNLHIIMAVNDKATVL